MKLLNYIKNNKIIYSSIFVVFILLGVYYSYRFIFLTWFAMDEWSFWENFLKLGPYYVIRSTDIIGILTGEIRFGLDLTNGLYFSLFGLNVKPWIITFLTLHLINIFLLFNILRRFKINPISSFIASFYFAVASAGQEALSWPAAGMQILGSAPFVLISIILTMNFVDSKKKIYLVLAVVCAYLSFLMRPTGIVTAGLIIALIFLFRSRTSFYKLPKFVYVLGISVLIIGVARVLMEYSDKIDLLAKAGFNTIFFPFVSLSHIFIPWRLMFRLSDSFTNFYYPAISNSINFYTVSHLIVADLISIIASTILLILFFILFKSVNKHYRKVLIFGAIFFILQFFVIALFYVDRNWGSYIDSRHMYLPGVGIAIVLGVLFNFISSNYKSSRPKIKFVFIIISIIFGVWLYKDMTVTRREVHAQAMGNLTIRETFKSLQNLNLPNSDKMIFFIESDRSYHYPEWKLPFKLPPPYMMSLAFYGRPFIDKQMLGKINYSNTFINENNKQFGYYTDIDKLVESIEKKEIRKEDVISLYFVESNNSFRDTTKKTQQLIDKNLSN